MSTYGTNYELRQGLDGRSAYELLGVKRDVSEADAKLAYRAKLKTEHPDKGGTEEAFRLLQVWKARPARAADLETSAGAPLTTSPRVARRRTRSCWTT